MIAINWEDILKLLVEKIFQYYKHKEMINV